MKNSWREKFQKVWEKKVDKIVWDDKEEVRVLQSEDEQKHEGRKPESSSDIDEDVGSSENSNDRAVKASRFIYQSEAVEDVSEVDEDKDVKGSKGVKGLKRTRKLWGIDNLETDLCEVAQLFYIPASGDILDRKGRLLSRNPSEMFPPYLLSIVRAADYDVTFLYRGVLIIIKRFK